MRLADWQVTGASLPGKVRGMHLPELLNACTRESHLRFLLIGGHAVIAHGYARTTFDIDLLVQKTDQPAWAAFLRHLGYQLGHQADAFLQWASTAGENLDLMLVNEATFEGMWSAALDRSIAGCTVKIPSLDHLIALKLHVLKQNLTHRSVKDLDDIIRLMLANHIDLRTSHYQHLFEKYGTAEEYQRVLRAIYGA